MAEVLYKAAFPSDFEEMVKVLDQGLKALIKAGCVPQGKEPCARLCLEEALVNAVRHGNQCDHTREVRLEILREGKDCRVRIWDEGQGFQPEDIQLPSADQPGGRGICLIRHFVDEIRFDRANKCFEMLFRWVT